MTSRGHPAGPWAADGAGGRLPDAEHLPVVVAARLSLSLPLLVSAIPLWSLEPGPEPAGVEAGREGDAAGREPVFHRHWFSDGGVTRNFPIHLFDAALPTRPTFAFHFGDFPAGRERVRRRVEARPGKADIEAASPSRTQRVARIRRVRRPTSVSR